MAFLNTNNANFYYELHGKGQPVILIAGYACDHLAWLPILDDLVKNFQVLLFDNRAVGQTKDDNTELTAKLMADDVIAIADQLNLVKPHIVGHSLGGAIAQTVASFYPQKISKLCLLNTSAKWRTAMKEGLKSIFIMREKNYDFNLIIDSIMAWLFGEEFFANKKKVDDFKNAILNNPFPQSIDDQRRQIIMTEKFDGVANLKNIQASTLILHGVEDIISLPMEAGFLANHIRDAKLVEFDCGHGVMFEKPRELVKCLVEFLS